MHIKAIFLKLNKPLHFQAGQYVQLQIPGIEGGRAFSIANTPKQVKDTGANIQRYLPRKDVLHDVEAAYTPKEEFRRYWTAYSSFEAAAAKKRIVNA